MTEPLNAEQKSLVQKNLDLAHFLAREAWNRNRDELDIEEVVSVAYQGLVKAALRFDPNRMSAETVANGKAFAGFARQRINGSILDWQREIDHVQRSYRQWYKQLKRLGYMPYETSRTELQGFAEEMGLDFEKLAQIIRAVEQRSLSMNADFHREENGEDYFTGPGGWWPNTAQASVESDVAGSQITEAMNRAYSRLPDTQKAVITLRWYAQEEFQVIAAELNISLTAVREAHSAALDTIHFAMTRAAAEQS